MPNPAECTNAICFQPSTRTIEWQVVEGDKPFVANYCDYHAEDILNDKEFFRYSREVPYEFEM